MTLLQQSGTKLSIRRGKPARRRQYPLLRGGAGMAVWFMRWLHCGDAIQTVDGIATAIGNDVIAPAALRRIHPVSRRIATFPGTVGTLANRLSRQRAEHARTCACAEPRRRDRLKGDSRPASDRR